MSTNPYKLLRDLMPDAPLQIGTITEAYGGVATIEMPGGVLVQARGVGNVGQQVFFRDQLIEGVAPALTIELIEV